jgi:hypothetical protein
MLKSLQGKPNTNPSIGSSSSKSSFLTSQQKTASSFIGKLNLNVLQASASESLTHLGLKKLPL